MQKYSKYALILVSIFLLLQFIFLLKFRIPIWDESIYVGMGKYLYSAGSSGLWEIIRPIGLPAILGFIWKLGLPVFLFSQIVSNLFAAATLFVVYLIGKKVFNEKIGLISLVLLASSPLFFLYSGYLLTEIPSVLFVLLSIYFWISDRQYLAPVFASLAVLFKFPNLLLIAVFGTVIAFSYFRAGLPTLFKKTASFFSIYTLVLIPFFLFNYFLYRADTSQLNHALFRPFILGIWHQGNPAASILINSLSSQLHNLFFYLIVLIQENFLFIFLLAGIVFIAIKKFYHNKHVLILVSYAVFYFAYFTFIINKQDRFLLLFLPIFSILTAVGIYHFSHFAASSKKYAGTILIILMLFASISITFTGVRDAKLYTWQYSEEPQVISELYKFFPNNKISGTILTTDPVFTVYSNNKFIPFYYSASNALGIYEDYVNETTAIVYLPNTYYCAPEDWYCLLNQGKLLNFLDSDYTPVFTGIYYFSDLNYTIYLRNA